MVSDDTVEVLARHEAIRQVLISYCRGIDRKDWDLVLRCFHPDAVDSHGAVDGTAQDLVDWTRAKHERVSQSMHVLSNVSFLEDSPSSVLTESYCSVRQTIERSGKPPAHLGVGCRYIDRLDRRESVWRIARRTVVYEWIHHLAVDRDLLAGDPSMPRSPRDLTDPSYLLRTGA
jgi:3-phenylpropionate/cinnamic acid dioxygenase small subunit